MPSRSSTASNSGTGWASNATIGVARDEHLHPWQCFQPAPKPPLLTLEQGRQRGQVFRRH